MQQNILSQKKIVVVGGGVAGLSFAIALRRLWNHDTHGPFPSITIFEREDRKRDIARAGYSLSLGSRPDHEGLQTIQRLGLMNDIIQAGLNKPANPGAYAIWDTKWRELYRIPVRKLDELPLASVRIARQRLRDVLAASAETHCSIEWGTTCKAVSPVAGTTGFQLELSNGSTAQCDVLVVAEGANSKLRTQLNPSATLDFAGAILISGTAKLMRPPYDQTWGFLTPVNGVLLFVSPLDDDTVFWNLSFRAGKAREVSSPPYEQIERELILDEARVLGEPYGKMFSDLIDATDVSTIRVGNAVERPPFPHAIDDCLPPNAAFIGDANHAVTQFSGNGANLALMDGWDLAESLCLNSTFPEALKMYDEKSIGRATRTLDKSHRIIKYVHWSIWSWPVVRVFIRFLVFTGLLGKQK